MIYKKVVDEYSCYACDGTGYLIGEDIWGDPSKIFCRDCGGRGYYTITTHYCDCVLKGKQETCGVCNGKGFFQHRTPEIEC